MNLFENAIELQGYPLRRAKRMLADIHALENADFTKWQLSQRWQIVEHHIRHNPFYSQLTRGKAPASWHDLPVLQKSDFQRPLDRLLSAGLTRKQVYVASTSGSSGHPFVFAKDKLCHALSWATDAYYYGMYHLRTNSRQARFYGIPMNPSGYWFEKAKDWIANRVRFPVFDLSPRALERFMRRFRRERFDFVYGYTSAVVLFARFLLERQVVLKEMCPSLQICILTSEVCTGEDKKLVETAFGVGVVREYGASELGMMAFEKPSGVFRCCEETIFFETAPGEDGTSHLLCTSLFNKAFPLIRYRIGDSVTFGQEDGRKSIVAIDGRVNDVVVLPSGKVSAGLTFYYISRRVLESSACLREFVVRQTRRDTFVFDVVADRQLKNSEIMELRRAMDMYLEPGLNLQVNYVEQIPRKGQGKIKHFFSELKESVAVTCGS